MRVFQKLLGTGAMGAMLLTAACPTNPEAGNQRLSKAAIGGVAGAVGGYFLGDLIGARGDHTGTIVGAGTGVVAGERQRVLEGKSDGVRVVLQEGLTTTK